MFHEGGIFDINQEDDQLAFNYAVNYNTNSTLRFLSDNRLVDHKNALNMYQTSCALLENGIIGLFAPTSSLLQSICDSKEMPLIETQANRKQPKHFINLHPHPTQLTKAYLDIIAEWQWKEFTILYENDDFLSGIEEMLMIDDKAFVLRQLEIDSSLTYRTVLNKIKLTDEKNFVIVSSLDVLEDVLIQAQQVGLINERFNYLIANLDMHTINLAAYQYAGCNITGIRLVDPEHSDMIDVAAFIQKMKRKTIAYSHLDAWKIRLNSALIIDGVSLYYNVVKDFRFADAHNLGETKLFCNQTDNWKYGSSLINLMKTKSINGLSGLIKFDNFGFRSEFQLHIVELTSGGLIKIGTWNQSEGVQLTPLKLKDTTSLHNDDSSLFNRSFVVITALTPPYGLLKDTTTQLIGNERFEGFGIDLIHELSLMLGFNYTFVIQDDGANGNYNRETKEWNGMIREIIDGRADLAITDLTITSEREHAVDFTMPFMNLGISILYRKPEPVPPSLFTFASPFSIHVWMLLGVAYFFVSISLFVIGRLCPKEWINPYPCIEEPDFLINQFTMRNSLWFTIGSLMQQGTEIAPVGVSTRMVAGVWWFFTLIMVSSYTANLAAFLTVETLVTSFKNIDELAEQQGIKYGAKQGGATSNFFRDSDIESYKKIWKYMYRHSDEMTSDNDDGVHRVLHENYAFLMESTTIEYIVERHCSLAQVGSLLDDKGYGIAMRKDSKYRNILSAAVLKLQETGKLTSLKIKWWKEKRGGGNCAARSAGGAATPLGLKNVEGVFFILVLGTILGIFGAFIELAVHILRKYKKPLFKKHFMNEIRFIVQFKKRTKIVKNFNDNELH